MVDLEEGDCAAGRLAMDPMGSVREQIVKWLRKLEAELPIGVEHDAARIIIECAADGIERGDYLPTERTDNS